MNSHFRMIIGAGTIFAVLGFSLGPQVIASTSPPPVGGGGSYGGSGGSSGGWGSGGAGGGWVPWAGCTPEVTIAWSLAKFSGATLDTPPPETPANLAKLYTSADGPNDFYNAFYSASNTTGTSNPNAPWIVLSDGAVPPNFATLIFTDDYSYACVAATPGTPPAAGWKFKFSASGLVTPVSGSLGMTSHILVYHQTAITMTNQTAPTDLFITGTAPGGSTFSASLTWYPLLGLNSSSTGATWSPGDGTSQSSGIVTSAGSSHNVPCNASGVTTCTQTDTNYKTNGTFEYTYVHVNGTGVTPAATITWVAGCTLHIQDPPDPAENVDDTTPGSIACVISGTSAGLTSVAVAGWPKDGVEFTQTFNGPTKKIYQTESVGSS